MEHPVDEFINLNNLEIASKDYGQEGPFDHAIIENFFSEMLSITFSCIEFSTPPK